MFEFDISAQTFWFAVRVWVSVWWRSLFCSSCSLFAARKKVKTSHFISARLTSNYSASLLFMRLVETFQSGVVVIFFFCVFFKWVSLCYLAVICLLRGSFVKHLEYWHFISIFCFTYWLIESILACSIIALCSNFYAYRFLRFVSLHLIWLSESNIVWVSL